MTATPPPATVMVSCSVLRAEVESLRRACWPDQTLTFLPSMMHMQPARLASSLEAVLDSELGRGRRVVLVYGDCCPQMTALEARPGVARTRGQNCCELLLGPEAYRRLAREGAFFLVPEWARLWKRVFAHELGLSHDNATSLMRELQRTLVYLDTGLAPVPQAELEACAAYCGLPCEVRPVTLDRLRLAIEEARSRCLAAGAPA